LRFSRGYVEVGAVAGRRGHVIIESRVHAILDALHAIVDAGEVVWDVFGVGSIRVFIVCGIGVFSWIVQRRDSNTSMHP
jgi:hypothetical protein